MAIYWNNQPIIRQRRRRVVSTLVLAAATLALLNWSPLWVVPTPTGAAAMLLVYMGVGFGVLVWAIRRVPIITGRDAMPLGPLVLVMLYLGMMALAVVPLLSVFGSTDVRCYDEGRGRICTGIMQSSDAEWQLEGQQAGDLPVLWVTARDFDDE